MRAGARRRLMPVGCRTLSAVTDRVNVLPKHGHLVKQSKVTAVSHVAAEQLGGAAEGKPQVFAVVTEANTQFKVSPGDRIIVNKVDGQAGETHVFDHVLLVGTPTKTFIGRPVIPDAKVTALIEEQTQDAKVIVFKRQPKNNSRRKTIGHRRKVSFLRITDIEYEQLGS